MSDRSGTKRPIKRRTVLQGLTAATGVVGAVGMLPTVARGGGRGTAQTQRVYATSVAARNVLPNVITIRSQAQTDVYYEFVVSGQVEPKGNWDPDYGDAVSGNAVTGVVGEQGGVDSYGFSGTITGFVISGGPAEILVNGEPVENPVGQPAGVEDTGTDVDQTGECVSVAPIRSGTRVTEFYGYTPDLDAPNNQQSNTGLEAAATSRLFFYQGPDGLSLVMIHGGGGGDRGGAATFAITGLPRGGEWVVLDDNYEGSRDRFELGQDSAVLHWSWGVEGRSDGAVFHGLGNNFEIRIDPAFNEAAALEPLGSGEVERWQLLSATEGGLKAYNLPLDQPIVLTTASC